MNNYNARALSENLPALERVCKSVGWYKDPTLDSIADFVAAGDYRAAYNEAANAFAANGYTAADDTSAYCADFVDLLAPHRGAVLPGGELHPPPRYHRGRWDRGPVHPHLRRGCMPLCEYRTGRGCLGHPRHAHRVRLCVDYPAQSLAALGAE